MFSLIVSLLYCFIFWFYLRSVNDTRVYTFIYKCVQTNVIRWTTIGSECNVVPYYVLVLIQTRIRTTWRCRAGWFWIIISDNWSVSTKWTIRTFSLAEKRKSHGVQHQKGTQKSNNGSKLKSNFKRIKRKRKTIMFHSYFFDFFVFQIRLFFPCSRRLMVIIKVIFWYKNQSLSSLKLDAL